MTTVTTNVEVHKVNDTKGSQEVKSEWTLEDEDNLIEQKRVIEKLDSDTFLEVLFGVDNSIDCLEQVSEYFQHQMWFEWGVDKVEWFIEELRKLNNDGGSQ